MILRRRARGGFVLVATLWTLAVLAVLASYIDSVVAADVDRTWRAKQQLQGEMARRGVEASLLYLLATNRSNHRAWVVPGGSAESGARAAAGDGEAVELSVAGDIYAAPGGIRFFIQDERGLACVNLPESPLFAAALRHAGIDERTIARLVPRLRDYIDLDRDLRLDGAEHFDYARADLRPPANWYFSAPGEIKRVLGLDAALDDATWRRLRPLLTTRITIGYNFNTMRAELMAALLGGDAATLATLRERRSEVRIASLEDIARLTGRRPRVAAGEITPLPSPSLRIATWQSASGQRAVRGIMLTPTAQAPWRTEYFYSEPVDDHSPAVRQLQTPLLQSG